MKYKLTSTRCHLLYSAGNLNRLRSLVNRSLYGIQHHLCLSCDSRPLPLRPATSIPDVLHKPREFLNHECLLWQICSNNMLAWQRIPSDSGFDKI